MKVKIARVLITLLILDFGFWILDFGHTGAAPIMGGASMPQSIQNPKSKIQNTRLPAGAWSLAYDARGSTAYALGPAGIMRTSDGGATWTACLPGARMMRLVNPLTQ